MFDKDKDRYLTWGIDTTIPLELQIFMWEAVDRQLEERDYLQVFNLSVENGLQVIKHTSEQPKHEMTYVLTCFAEAVTAKIYVIDDGDHCTMLLAEEY